MSNSNPPDQNQQVPIPSVPNGYPEFHRVSPWEALEVLNDFMLQLGQVHADTGGFSCQPNPNDYDWRCTTTYFPQQNQMVPVADVPSTKPQSSFTKLQAQNAQEFHPRFPRQEFYFQTPPLTSSSHLQSQLHSEPNGLPKQETTPIEQLSVVLNDNGLVIDGKHMCMDFKEQLRKDLEEALTNRRKLMDDTYEKYEEVKRQLENLTSSLIKTQSATSEIHKFLAGLNKDDIPIKEAVGKVFKEIESAKHPPEENPEDEEVAPSVGSLPLTPSAQYCKRTGPHARELWCNGTFGNKINSSGNRKDHTRREAANPDCNGTQRNARPVPLITTTPPTRSSSKNPLKMMELGETLPKDFGKNDRGLLGPRPGHFH